GWPLMPPRDAQIRINARWTTPNFNSERHSRRETRAVRNIASDPTFNDVLDAIAVTVRVWGCATRHEIEPRACDFKLLQSKWREQFGSPFLKVRPTVTI